MKIRQSFLPGVLALAVTLTSPSAFAADGTPNEAELKDRRWYVGGGIGASDDKDFDDTEGGGKVFGGYRVSRYFTLEGSLVGLGEFGDGTLGIDSGGTFAKGGLSLEAVGTLPITERFQLFGKAGGFFWSILAEKTCVTVGSDLVCVDDGRFDDGVDPVYGGGLQYRFSDRWGGRFEWERYKDVGKDDVDLTSVSVIYSF